MSQPNLLYYFSRYKDSYLLYYSTNMWKKNDFIVLKCVSSIRNRRKIDKSIFMHIVRNQDQKNIAINMICYGIESVTFRCIYRTQ
jgi:hypothetical protein